MRPVTRTASISTVIAVSAAMVAGCSSSPVSITGTWSASDGSETKIINGDGSCSGMYYNGTSVLDIGGPETCTLSSTSTGGYYSLVVRQAPNQITYQVAIDGDTMTLTTGGQEVVTLTRQ
ncbi:hypothetical protein [Cellulomonas sp. KRMCY2]|uniref:hypothetical protein n=1 Tax=Cellulomonas sp. KRMCY2 TaxID=1304865 RepID=UPI00045E8F4D|nr:hypothetical protein [Cellulomonas sp. KRMCY2]